MPKPTTYRVDVIQDESGAWALKVYRQKVEDVRLCTEIIHERLRLCTEIIHERTQRHYASAEDCATSLRHLLKSLPRS